MGHLMAPCPPPTCHTSSSPLAARCAAWTAGCWTCRGRWLRRWPRCCWRMAPSRWRYRSSGQPAQQSRCGWGSCHAFSVSKGSSGPPALQTGAVQLGVPSCRACSRSLFPGGRVRLVTSACPACSWALLPGGKLEARLSGAGFLHAHQPYDSLRSTAGLRGGGCWLHTAACLLPPLSVPAGWFCFRPST